MARMLFGAPSLSNDVVTSNTAPTSASGPPAAEHAAERFHMPLDHMPQTISKRVPVCCRGPAGRLMDLLWAIILMIVILFSYESMYEVITYRASQHDVEDDLYFVLKGGALAIEVMTMQGLICCQGSRGKSWLAKHLLRQQALFRARLVNEARFAKSEQVAAEVGAAAALAQLEVRDPAYPPLQELMPPPDSYQGLTNTEDFDQVSSAVKVHILSSPWITNKPAAAKAAATKMFHDKPSVGVYTFNPNSGLRAAALAVGMSEEQQGRRWLTLWTQVAKRVKDTGGTCFVIAKATGPSPNDFALEGSAQQGEINVANLAGISIEYVMY